MDGRNPRPQTLVFETMLRDVALGCEPERAMFCGTIPDGLRSVGFRGCFVSPWCSALADAEIALAYSFMPQHAEGVKKDMTGPAFLKKVS